MIVKVKKIIPTESQEMNKLMDWANIHPRLKHPVFGNILVHIPNEGKRSVVGNMKLFGKGGAKSGFPDLFLPLSVEKNVKNYYLNREWVGMSYHGMFIELKRTNFKSPRPTNVKSYALHARQMAWIDYLNNSGFHAVICSGADIAIEEIEEYLNE